MRKTEKTVLNLIVVSLNLETGTGLLKNLNHAAAAAATIDDDESVIKFSYKVVSRQVCSLKRKLKVNFTIII
jgi:hypothetical protein